MDKEKELIVVRCTNEDAPEEERVYEGYEELSDRCDEIDIRKENALMREIILALKDTMKEKNILSLAANQIGYNKRIFVINFSGEYKTFINPIITRADKLVLSQEICHSIPDKVYIRPRHDSIYISYQTPLGKIESRQLIGKAAIVFQHALDHLDGLLLSDIGLEVDDDYFNASDAEKAKVLKFYKESLDIKTEEVNKIINEDENLKKMSDAIDFMTSVQKGEVTFVPEKVTFVKDKKETEEKENGECDSKD